MMMGEGPWVTSLLAQVLGLSTQVIELFLHRKYLTLLLGMILHVMNSPKVNEMVSIIKLF